MKDLDLNEVLNQLTKLKSPSKNLLLPQQVVNKKLKIIDINYNYQELPSF